MVVCQVVATYLSGNYFSYVGADQEHQIATYLCTYMRELSRIERALINSITKFAPLTTIYTVISNKILVDSP